MPEKGDTMKTRTVQAILDRETGSSRKILTVPNGIPLAVLADGILVEAMLDKDQPRVGLDDGHGMVWFVHNEDRSRAVRIPEDLA
jgi:hypothetical protein